jgi:hypothetical protein
MLLVMLHHPVAGHGPDRAAAIQAVGPLSEIVHGTLIALLLVSVAALQHAADRLRALGIDPRAGSFALAVSAAGFVIAASVSGFIVPQIAAEAGKMGEAQRAAFPLIAQALFHTNQYCVVFATLAMGVALLAWSLPLVPRRGLARWPGVVGVLAGAAAIVAMLAGSGRVDVRAMTLMVAVFGLWLICLAVWLWHPPQAVSAK